MICSRCLYGNTIPDITFDNQGVCNYCHIHDQFDLEYPTGKRGSKILQSLVSEIKIAGIGEQYDVVVGISGGCDSSYLLYLTKALGLRPLAVHFDNTWNAPIAKRNMQNVLDALDVDSYIVEVDKDEYDDICRSFLMAGVSDVDIPNDIGLTTALYRAAEKYNIRYIFIGHSFRTEGIAPIGWTYMDGKYIQSVQKRYGTYPLKTFPNLWMRDFIRWTAIKGIKRIRPLYYVDYVKEDIKKFLSDNLNWDWYGGHHLENRYTAFVISHYLPRRYGIDMRILGYSALVRSGQMDRDEGLALLKKIPIISIREIEKRLDIDVNKMLVQPMRTHHHFKTYRDIFKRFRLFWWAMYRLGRVPKSFYIKYAQ